MKPITFHCGRTEYTITEQGLMKNGELKEEGKVFIFNLIFGQPAWFIIKKGDHFPPVYVQTDPVTSLLPIYEHFDGESNPQKDVYILEFRKHGERFSRIFKCLAVDTEHAEELLRLKYSKEKADVLSNKKSELSFAEGM